jgi:hypothetical protein
MRTSARPLLDTPKRPVVYLAGALAIGLILLMLMPWHRMLEGSNDFAHWYIGGLLFGTPDLHSAEANQAKQVQFIGGVLKHSYFIRPTFYGFFLKPLSWMPYKVAYWTFQLFSLGCLVYFLRRHSRDYPDVVLLAAMSPPVLANFINGQDVMLLLALCTASIALARSGNDMAAGMVLALCAIKIHLFVFVPLALLLKRRWWYLLGGVFGGLMLLAISLAGGGVEAFIQLFRLIRNPINHPEPAIMPNLRGLVYVIRGEDNTLLAALWVTVAVMVIWIIWRTAQFEVAIAACLAGGLLVNFHAYIQDCTLLLLVAALVAPHLESKGIALLLTLLLLPPVYLMLHAGPPWSGAFHLLMLAFLAGSVWHWERRGESPAPV